MNIKLFISSFGGDTAWSRKHIKDAVTIQVGADCRQVLPDNVGGVTLLDNTGDNISADNPYWGELTGLYWIWKNIKFNDGDIVGFCHYNKMLNISERGIKKFFKKNPRGWLVSNYAYVPLDNDDFVIQSFKKIFQTNFPDYYNVWQKFEFYNSNVSAWLQKYSPSNLFYTDANSFIEYCEWLFNILFKLRLMVGNIERAPTNKRYCALIGERIMTSYLERNHKIYETTFSIGASTPFYAFLSRTAHKLNLDINARYYDLIRSFFRKYTHYRPATSSWAKE